MAAESLSLLASRYVFLAIHIYISQALKVTGVLTTKEDWAFITRFCFLSKIGALSYDISYPKDLAVQNLLLYYDNNDQWPSVYGTSAVKQTCTEKESVLKPDNNQKISLTPSYPWSGCEEVQKYGLSYYNCSGRRTFESARERWWYVVLDNCNTTRGLGMSYTIHMTNGDNNDTFFTEFSADEFYILQVDIAFIIGYALILLFTISVAATLYGRQMLHTTYKMFTWSVILEVTSLVLMVGYYSDYAVTGVPKHGLRTVGRIMDAASNLLFLLMLILMGKGYTITRGRLSSSGSVKIGVFMTVYVIAYAAVFIWDSVVSDPGEVLYIYDSPPGYALIGLKLIGWVWFCYAVAFTIKHHPERRAFFYLLIAFFTVWFWAGPTVTLIAMEVMYPWIREKVVNAVQLCVILCGHVAFLILTRPSAANKNFPYHIRTTQIGILTETSNVDLSSENRAYQNGDNYVGNPYTITSDMYSSTEPPRDYMGMFSTARTAAGGNQNQSAVYETIKES